MAQSKLLLERKGSISLVRLNDPATYNALSMEMVVEIHAAVQEAERTSRVIVLCGGPKAFSSGANLATGMGLDKLGPDFDAGEGLEQAINPLMLALRDLRIPIVSAVCGAAAGVGASLALVADLIVAGESAYFLQAFRRVGLVPDGGATYLLSRAAGRVRAMEMMLLGERIPAAKALGWGLINRVVADDEVEPAALQLAEALANGPTRALGLIRRAAWRATDGDLASALATEREFQREAGRSPDFREGVEAFLEKRTARFKGE